MGEILGCQYSGGLLVRIGVLFRCSSGRRSHHVANVLRGVAAARQGANASCGKVAQSGVPSGTVRGWFVRLCEEP